MNKTVGHKEQIELYNITQRINEIRTSSSRKQLNYYEDGIINIESYNNAAVKILWILKETDGDFNPKCFLNKKNIFKRRISRTWKPIAETSHLILHNEFSKDNYVLSKTIQEIAVINIKKTPGGTSSCDDVIKNFYVNHKDLILKQMSLINPDVVIGGNTLKFLKDDLQLKSAQKIGYTFDKDNFDMGNYCGNNTFHYFIFDDRLYISTYHPNRKIKYLTNKIYARTIKNVFDIWNEYLQNKTGSSPFTP